MRVSTLSKLILNVSLLVLVFVVPASAQEQDVPIIVQHLPEWQDTQKHAVYAANLPALQQAASNKPALDAVSFAGGTEAATAVYGAARLVVVEFTTPQYASDNDARVNERIAQLRDKGQLVPSAYKRVGNYLVFVFDAADAASADELISNVKYEKDVRWLGRNPHAANIAMRHYTATMGHVILSSMITTGASILLCLSVGGLLGGAIFMYRRAKGGAHEVFSDAGGMMRLNLEELNPKIHSSNLLDSGEK